MPKTKLDKRAEAANGSSMDRKPKSKSVKALAAKLAAIALLGAPATYAGHRYDESNADARTTQTACRNLDIAYESATADIPRSSQNQLRNIDANTRDANPEMSQEVADLVHGAFERVEQGGSGEVSADDIKTVIDKYCR